MFDREAHFCSTVSEDQVPRLGAPDAPKSQVEAFYDFWYNFDSWRTFEWLDKEINEGSNKYVFDVSPNVLARGMLIDASCQP